MSETISVCFARKNPLVFTFIRMKKTFLQLNIDVISFLSLSPPSQGTMMLGGKENKKIVCKTQILKLSVQNICLWRNLVPGHAVHSFFYLFTTLKVTWECSVDSISEKIKVSTSFELPVRCSWYSCNYWVCECRDKGFEAHQLGCYIKCWCLSSSAMVISGRWSCCLSFYYVISTWLRRFFSFLCCKSFIISQLKLCCSWYRPAEFFVCAFNFIRAIILFSVSLVSPTCDIINIVQKEKLTILNL